MNFSNVYAQLDFVPRPEAITPSAIRDRDNLNANLFTGSIGYSYSIEVPPWINGFTPNIVFSYNHHATKALPTELGTAWAINNYQIIRDINYTRNNTNNDYYILRFNGLNEKLIYVNSEGRYHTEHETFLHISKLANETNQNNEYWLIKSKDGTQYRFGFNNNSELVSNLESYTVSWSMDQITDVMGNKINYSYIENPNSENGSVYLDRINYGLNLIDFVYDYTIYNPFTVYSNGVKIKKSGLLDRIEIKNNQSLVRKYDFKYFTINNKPYFSNITYIGSDNVTALPPVKFFYNQFEVGFTETSAWQVPAGAYFGTSADEGVRLLDVNGDGATDILKAEGTEHKVWYNNKSGFSAGVNVTNFIPNGFSDTSGNDRGVRFLDLNADTRTDTVQALNNSGITTKLKSFNGTKWVNRTYNLPSEIIFIEKSTQSCTPSFLTGYICSDSFSCNSTTCSRNCNITVCGASGTQVFDEITYVPSWTDDNYDMADIGAGGYTPQSNYCYMFEFIGSDDTDSGDQSECYELTTDDYYEDDDYDRDCDDEDLDAYASIGFIGDATSTSWLSTVPGGEDFGFVPNVVNTNWEYRYSAKEDKTLVPDESGSDAGEWEGFNEIICDEAGTHTIYCAPTQNMCAAWGKDRCGYECVGEITYPYVAMGVYQSNYNDIRDAWADYDPACSSNMMVENQYSSGSRYRVTRYSTSTQTATSTCQVSNQYRDESVRLVDVNSDGRTDIIKATSNISKTWINNGSGFSIDNSWKVPTGIVFASNDGRDKGIRFADVNGDGLIDILRGENNATASWINTGKGWVNDTSFRIPLGTSFVYALDIQGLNLMDINSDGLNDLVKAKDSIANVWINYGNNWTATSWEFPFNMTFDDYSHQLVDVNGDGSPDVIKATNTQQKTWISDAYAPYYLAMVENGIGGTIEFEYKPIAALDNSGGDGVQDLGFEGYVIKQVSKNNGMGHISNISYNFSGGYFDAGDKDFRGFSFAKESKPDNIAIKHYFFQNDSKAGLEYKTEIFDDTIKLLTKETNFRSTYTNNYYKVLINNTKESIYDGYQTPKIILRSFDYDTYGNLNKTFEQGFTSVSGDETTTYSRFVYNTNKWILNKPKRIFVIDSDGSTKLREVNYTYDSLAYGSTPTFGLLTKEIKWLSTETSPNTQYSYDSVGNLVTRTDENSGISRFNYSSTRTYLIKSKNQKNHEEKYTYDEGTGNLLTVRDSNGLSTQYSYDVLGRKIKEIRPYDNTTYPTTNFSYVFDGIVPEKIIMKNRETEKTAKTFDKITFYDGFGREIQTKVEAPDSRQIVYDVLYDTNERIDFERNPYFTSSSFNYTTPNVSVKGINYSYDGLNRMRLVTNPDGTYRLINYSRRNITLFDENNNKKQHILDAYNNIIKIYEFNENQAYKTEYRYDDFSNIIQINDSQGNVFNFTYDSLGRKTKLVDPDLGIWKYTYDNVGNLIRQNNSNGNLITLTYDSLNRITRKNSSSQTVTFTYDELKNGTLSKVTTLLGDKVLKYDNRYRLNYSKEQRFAISLNTTFAYDSMDRMTRKTLPSGIVITYNYTNGSNLNGISNALKQTTYNELNLPSKRKYLNGIDTNFTYKTDNLRLSAIKTSNAQNFKYTYDNVGNILKINDTVNLRIQEMGYDELDRLTNADMTNSSGLLYSFNYTYSSIGNIEEIESIDGNSLYNYGNSPVHSPESITQ